MSRYKLETDVYDDTIDDIFDSLLSQVDEDVNESYVEERRRNPEDDPEDCADAAAIHAVKRASAIDPEGLVQECMDGLSNDQARQICEAVIENFVLNYLEDYLWDKFCTPEYYQEVIRNNPERLNNRKPSKANRTVKTAKNSQTKPRTAKKQVRKR